MAILFGPYLSFSLLWWFGCCVINVYCEFIAHQDTPADSYGNHTETGGGDDGTAWLGIYATISYVLLLALWVVIVIVNVAVVNFEAGDTIIEVACRRAPAAWRQAGDQTGATDGHSRLLAFLAKVKALPAQFKLKPLGGCSNAGYAIKVNAAAVIVAVMVGITIHVATEELIRVI